MSLSPHETNATPPAAAPTPRGLLRWLPVPAALALIVMAGVANGLWTDRWGPSHELETMTRRVAAVPLDIGDWHGQDTRNEELTDRLKREGTLHELVSRVYTEASSGESVSLMLATGRPGPISTHNPLTCYGGVGFDPEGRIGTMAVRPPGAPPARFARCSFQKGGPEREELTVYWGWRTPKGWVADTAADPRFNFVTQRALTKLYVVRQGGGRRDPGGRGDDLALRFLNAALPVIDATLAGD
jgi:hypothetical protein